MHSCPSHACLKQSSLQRSRESLIEPDSFWQGVVLLGTAFGFGMPNPYNDFPTLLPAFFVCLKYALSFMRAKRLIDLCFNLSNPFGFFSFA